MGMRVLIKNAHILTMENDNIIKDTDILIEDKKIAFVGKPGERVSVQHLKEDGPGADFVIDGANKLAMPGLVNAHTHCGMSLLRNYADDLPLEKWLFEKMFPVEDRFAAEDVYWATMLSIVEMIRGGTTCFADMYFFMDQVARAVDETGMRATLSRGLQCFDNDFDVSTDRRMNESRQLFKDWHGKAGGRIRVDMGPHSVYTCTPPYLEACADLARELKTGIHIHILETDTEKKNSLKNFGVSTVQHCLECGVLDVPVMAAHSVHLDRGDMRIFADNRVNVVHCPGSNLKLGSGVADIAALKKHEINICLGTDSAASNNDLDMFEELRLAATLHKGIKTDPVLITAFEALEMATVNGAFALGFGDRTGFIKKGYNADMILLDIDRPNYYPQHNLVSAAVYSSKSSDVDTVIVDGKILMQNRKLKTIDEEMVKFKVKECMKRIF